MHTFGELASLGSLSLPSVLWVTRLMVRDIMEYSWKKAVLNKTPSDQMAQVIHELSASPREARK